MSKHNRSTEPPSPAAELAGADAREPQPSGRPWWVRITVCVILAGLIVTLVVVQINRRPRTGIADAADKASPEVAALLHEIDDVTCTLIEQFPESPEAWDVIARLHYRMAKSDEAITYWKHCLELSPDFFPACQAIGMAYLETGKHAESIEYFRRAKELMPTSPTVVVEYAQALIADGKAEEAVRMLRDDVARHPRSMASLAMLGHASIQLRQYAEAKQYFLLAIELGPEYANAYDGLVKACVNLGEEELAKQYAETLKLLKSKDADVHRKGLKNLDDALNVRLTVAEVYASAANVYLYLDDPQTAERFLLKSIEMAPRRTTAREVLGWLYQRQGRDKEAVTVLEELLEIAPDSLGAQMSCGELWAKMAYYDKAEAAYRKAIALTPKQAGGYAALAGLLVQTRRKLPEARQLAQQAVDLEPVARYFFLLGATCKANNDLPAARDAVGRAAGLAPGNEEYGRVYEIIDQQIPKTSSTN